MKAIKGRAAIARGVILLPAIVLALAMVLPALADGPNGHGAKPEKSESDIQAAGGTPSGAADLGHAGQAKKGNPVDGLPENSNARPGEQNQTRRQQAGQPEQPGQREAKLDPPSSQGKRDQARSRQASSQGMQGQAKAQPDKANSGINKRKASLDPANPQANRGQAQSSARLEPVVDPGKPELSNTQMESSKFQFNQAHRPGAPFTPASGTYDLCRSKGKPQPVSFPFSDISQGGGIITISNTDGLKNLRITVNGQRFQVPLGNQASPTRVDVSSALLDPSKDSVIFTPLGKPGTCAMVLPGM